jgi:hypothetical protein
VGELRTVTFVMEFEQKDAPKALWDLHASGETDRGIKVVGIAEGNAIQELEELELSNAESEE